MKALLIANTEDLEFNIELNTELKNLQQNGEEIIDIKFSTTKVHNEEVILVEYAALILYR